MSRNNRFSPPKGNCTSELREKAKAIWLGWNEALSQHTNRKGIPFPLRYSNNQPVPSDSLLHSICGWVANNPDWEEQWATVTKRLEVRGHFLRGYRGFYPTLAWLFKDKGKDRQRPLETVLDGGYDTEVNTYADEKQV